MANKSSSQPKVSGAVVKPMLAKVADAPFSSPEWIFEVKWDGYRAIAETGKKEPKLYSRNGLSFKEKYATVAEALKKIKTPAVLDGEIVALNEKGISDFQRLQDYENHQEDLYYYVFDLLSFNGKDLKDQPLLERKKRLKKLLEKKEIIRYSDHIKENGEDFFKEAKKKNLEGIMAKEAKSTYLPGKRTGKWLKIKNRLTMEAVIGGFTEPRGSRKYFGSLILGVFQDKKLQYIGHTGTGFSQKRLRELYEKMEPLIQKKSPFSSEVPVNNPATWLRPKLVCNIEYAEKTREGILRQSVFQGLRTDKEAKEIQWEHQMNL